MTCVKCKVDSYFTHRELRVEVGAEDRHNQLKCSSAVK